MEERAYRSSWLKRLYNQYNKKYWGGKLPDVLVGYMTTRQVSQYGLDKELCAFTTFDDEKHTTPLSIVIIMPKHKQIPYIKADLLHECIHVAYPRAGHGKVFQDEIKRLVNAGAFKGIL